MNFSELVKDSMAILSDRDMIYVLIVYVFAALMIFVNIKKQQGKIDIHDPDFLNSQFNRYDYSHYGDIDDPDDPTTSIIYSNMPGNIYYNQFKQRQF